MASSDCTCCGAPATVPEPVEIEPEECACGCFDCDDCPDCYHDEDEVVTVQPPVLCDGCAAAGGAGDCDPLDTWHRDGRGGHSCDGSGCEAYDVRRA
jgi:hypothetical protein